MQLGKLLGKLGLTTKCAFKKKEYTKISDLDKLSEERSQQRQLACQSAMFRQMSNVGMWGH